MKLFGFDIKQSLMGLVLLGTSLGCSQSSDNKSVSGDVKTRIPWFREGGEYVLDEILLKGVHSLFEFSGDAATFYIYPTIQDGKLRGQTPKARFLKSGSVYVPTDTLSQQLAVIYAHMQNLEELDEQVGAVGINSKPREVGVAVRYKDGLGEMERNNAFYDGQSDSMLIVPYTQSFLPIPVNGGILAHEYFHSLYFKLVEKNVFKSRARPLHSEKVRDLVVGVEAPFTGDTKAKKPVGKSEDSDSYHMALSRALNEGLADFWAWVYTGDPDFLAASLPSEKGARSLNLGEPPKQFTSTDLFKFRLDNRYYKSEVGENCVGARLLYCLGSEYARTLTHFARLIKEERSCSIKEARVLVAQAVIKSLPKFAEALLNLKQNEYFQPVQFFVFVQESTPGLTQKEKDFIDNLVQETLRKKVSITEGPIITEGEAAR